MKNNTHSTSKFVRCMKAPVRALRGVRDLYVNGMTGCTGKMHCGSTNLPRSFSMNSSQASVDEDLRELIRAASMRSRGEKVTETPLQPAMGLKGLPKSYSVGMARIDEDEPCDFQDDYRANSEAVLYPRSRSYAVNGRRWEMSS
ncbi:uncharacterized protein LOC131229261 [Magnolia sinica]|uniref:uncharacterized protein LOC131229261 n=1 Tax=Magnolia sinica TaxID=86752 RepID=UPI0026599877|nr:uncharacterized protein LOC131229261 [Magnolia sinica]